MGETEVGVAESPRRTRDNANDSRGESLPRSRPAIEDHAARLARMIRVCIASVLASVVLYGFYYYLVGAWQMLAVASSGLLAVAGLAFALAADRRGRREAAGRIALVSLLVVPGAVSLFVEGVTLYIAALALLLTALLGVEMLPAGSRFWVILAAAFALSAWAIDLLVPVPRFVPSASGTTGLFLLGASAIPLALVVWHSALIPLRAFTSIRARLVVTSLLLVIFTGGAISYFSSIVLTQIEEREAIDRLNMEAQSKSSQLEDWAGRLQDALGLFSRSAGPQLTTVLRGAGAGPGDYAGALDHLRADLSDTFIQVGLFDELYVLDSSGRVVVAVGGAEGAAPPVDAECLRQALSGTCLQPPRYYAPLGRRIVVAARGVTDPAGQPLGVLAGYAGMSALDAIAQAPGDLGRTGEVYLVGADHALLTASRLGNVATPANVRSEGAAAAIDRRTNGSALYVDYRGVKVVGAYRWLPTLRVGLLAEQDQAEAFQESAMLTQVHIAITLVLLAGAALMALYMVRTITAPLGGLAAVVARIAGGELEADAEVKQSDEIGALARAFNQMTARLRAARSQLEQRTEELARANSDLESENAVRRKAESELQLERNKLKSILDAMEDGVYIVNREYDVEYMNPALQRLFGDLGGRKCHAYLYERDEPCPWCPNAMVWQGISVRREQALKDGKYYELFDTPIPNADGSLAKLALFHDVTARKQAEEEILLRNRELATLSRRLVEVQESERHYISRELHDETGQALTSLMLRLGILERDLQHGAPLADRITELKHTVEEVIQGLHGLAVDLRPPSLDHVGLLPALRQYAERITDQQGLAVDFGAIGFDEERLPAEMEITIYRIVQEALANAVRHSGATHADVVVERRADRVRIIIEDNGRGFDPALAAESDRLGLIGMRERAEMLGGSLVIESAPGAGTTVLAEAPYDRTHTYMR